MQFLTYQSTVSQLEHLGFSEALQGFIKIFENTNYEKVKGIICIDRVQNWNILNYVDGPLGSDTTDPSHEGITDNVGKCISISNT